MWTFSLIPLIDTTLVWLFFKTQIIFDCEGGYFGTARGVGKDVFDWLLEENYLFFIIDFVFVDINSYDFSNARFVVLWENKDSLFFEWFNIISEPF